MKIVSNAVRSLTHSLTHLTAKARLFLTAALVLLAFASCEVGMVNLDNDAVSTPASPSALTSTSAGSGMSTLSWTEPVDTEFTHVLIDWSPNGPDAPVSVPKGTTEYIATELNNTTEYTFSVRSVGARGSQSDPIETTVIPGICGDLSPSNMPVFAGRDSSIISGGTGSLADPFIIHLSDNCANIAFAWNMAGLSTEVSDVYIRYANLKDNQVEEFSVTLLEKTGINYMWILQGVDGTYPIVATSIRWLDPITSIGTRTLLQPPQSSSTHLGMRFVPHTGAISDIASPQGTFRIGVTP